MLSSVHPKLPMRNASRTKDYYVQQLAFDIRGEYDNYLIVGKDQVELHFFLSPELDPRLNDGQVYIRTNSIHAYYQELLDRGVSIHPNSPLAQKPWGQIEFALLDPDNNLLTFGQANDA